MADTPDFSFEQAAFARGLTLVAGVDEAGRGPLAGPVVAAAVILDPKNIPAGLNDSKQLSARRRESLYRILQETADVGIGEATVAEIEQFNILRAAHLAMVRAVARLRHPPQFVLIDGNLVPRDLMVPAQAIIGGDARSLSIAAASIVAKTWRDNLMVDLAQQYPGYGWDRNAGYPTKGHKNALQNLGVTPHHRRLFKPVYNILYQEKNLSD
jgi:ribonuclease HII